MIKSAQVEVTEPSAAHGRVNNQAMVLINILIERMKQRRKWGDQTHTPERWGMILGEEFGEFCKEIVELPDREGPYHSRIELARKELYQMVAVGVQILEEMESWITDEAHDENKREEDAQ